MGKIKNFVEETFRKIFISGGIYKFEIIVPLSEVSLMKGKPATFYQGLMYNAMISKSVIHKVNVKDIEITVLEEEQDVFCNMKICGRLDNILQFKKSDERIVFIEKVCK